MSILRPARSAETHLQGKSEGAGSAQAHFEYQRMQFPQISGNGRAYVTAVGGHAKLGIRVAKDPTGRPMVSRWNCGHYRDFDHARNACDA